MKKILLPCFILISAQFGFSQCEANYDFGSEPFGVYPDPVEGQTFATGYLNVPYEDVLHVKVPSDAGAFDELFTGVAITKVSVESITVYLAEFEMTLAQLGLSYTCNNGGTLPDPCEFQGGQQGCAVITGTPTASGVFDIVVTLSVHTSFLTLPFEYDGYTLTIEQDVSIADGIGGYSFRVEQSAPNPFHETATVQYELPSAGEVTIKVMNLMGELVYHKTVMGKPGLGKFKLTANEIPAGIYLYTVEYGNEKVTKRMVVNK